MKKIIFSLMGIALLGLTLTSCNKEENLVNGNPVFTASLDGTNSKTHFESDGLTLKWDDITATGVEENITVNAISGSQTYAAEYSATTISSNVATFIYSSGDDLPTENVTYRVVYPTSAYVGLGSDNKVRINLPDKQYYNANKIITDFPMYAETDDTHLKFKNLCGVLKLNLQKTGKSVRTITVISQGTDALRGHFDVTYNNGNPTLTPAGDYTNTNDVVLDCGSAGVDITTAQDFYIYLPPKNYSSQLEIEIMYTDYSQTIKYKAANTNFEILRNNQYTLTFDDDDMAINSTKGVFSIGPTEQVYFSSGNLMYYDGVWKVSKEQWGRLTAYNDNRWMHFGWSTPSTNYGMNTSTSDATYSGSFKDWSSLLSDNTLGWFTLDYNGWDYLLHTRTIQITSSQTVTGGCFWATVNNVPGMLLIPDNYSQSNADNVVIAFNTNTNFASNTFNLNQWKYLENKGCAFLPSAGRRDGTSMYTNESSDPGFYWTSFSNNSEKAYAIYFRLQNGNVTQLTLNLNAGRHTGYCVRLVRPVETSTTSK